MTASIWDNASQVMKTIITRDQFVSTARQPDRLELTGVAGGRRGIDPGVIVVSILTLAVALAVFMKGIEFDPSELARGMLGSIGSWQNVSDPESCEDPVRRKNVSPNCRLNDSKGNSTLTVEFAGVRNA